MIEQLNWCVRPQIVTGNGNYVVGTNLHRFVYTVSCPGTQSLVMGPVIVKAGPITTGQDPWA